MPWERSESVSYSAMHKRLYVDKGKASDHSCYFCDAPAKQWMCINNKTESGLHAKKQVKYSLNIDDYVPGCRSCNAKFDMVLPEQCKRGHSEWYFRSKGDRVWRVCAPCHREQKRKIK